MNLIIDIGNTYTKVALFEHTADGDKLVDMYRRDTRSVREALQLIPDEGEIEKAIISSVIDLTQETLDFIHALPFSVMCLRSNTPTPIVLDYKTPRTIGSDRIAAVVGARKMFPDSNLLVIDIGTAITYDFITSDAVFHGGNIAPGKKMRFTSLHRTAAHLPLIEADGEATVCGHDTETAIRGGVLQGIAFEIQGYEEYYRRQYSDLKVVITGGDANLFKPLLPDTYCIAQHLVLEGLNHILNYENA